MIDLKVFQQGKEALTLLLVNKLLFLQIIGRFCLLARRSLHLLKTRNYTWTIWSITN